MENKSPFKVPEDYFNNLTERINENVQEQIKKEDKPKIISIFNSFKPYVAIAASFIIVWLLFNVVLSNLNIDQSQKIVAIADSTDINNTKSTTENLEVEAIFDDIATTDESVEAVIEYLIDEDFDAELILAEL